MFLEIVRSLKKIGDLMEDERLIIDFRNASAFRTMLDNLRRFLLLLLQLLLLAIGCQTHLFVHSKYFIATDPFVSLSEI